MVVYPDKLKFYSLSWMSIPSGRGNISLCPYNNGPGTALSFWIVACIIFVFTAFLSYVFILIKLKIPKKVKDTQMDKTDKPDEPLHNSFLDIDIVLLFFNMVAFILFAILYWTTA